MNKPLTPEVLQAMLDVSEALRAKLLDEKAALLAQPSPIFRPCSTTEEGRQLEREAFAKGLHHAAISCCRHA
jgi:hypothetical protein